MTMPWRHRLKKLVWGGALTVTCAPAIYMGYSEARHQRWKVVHEAYLKAAPHRSAFRGMTIGYGDDQDTFVKAYQKEPAQRTETEAKWVHGFDVWKQYMHTVHAQSILTDHFGMDKRPFWFSRSSLQNSYQGSVLAKELMETIEPLDQALCKTSGKGCRWNVSKFRPSVYAFFENTYNAQQHWSVSNKHTYPAIINDKQMGY
jgi:hypothetical protein